MLAVFCLSLACACAVAEEQSAFPEGVVVVPAGTQISIDDQDTVTITDCPVEIQLGDTFVVYLQDLPIGYKAVEVVRQGNTLIVQAERSEESVYSQLEDYSGEIALTSDMYEFIPAQGVTRLYGADGSHLEDGLNYSDGMLYLRTSLGGSYIYVYLSDMSLTHTIKDGRVGVVFKVKWGVEDELNYSEDLLEDISLGRVRVYGVGVLELNLSLEMDMSMGFTLDGSLSAGFAPNDEGGYDCVRSFSVGTKKISGRGGISMSLKVLAGEDILVAEADVYAEMKVQTDFMSQVKYDEKKERNVHCQNYWFCVYLKYGAEAKYFSPIEIMNRMKCRKTRCGRACGLIYLGQFGIIITQAAISRCGRRFRCMQVYHADVSRRAWRRCRGLCAAGRC